MIFKSLYLKHLIITLIALYLLSEISFAQLAVSKLVGKEDKQYGYGAGLFAYLDIPIKTDNQSLRLELFDFAYFPVKGEGFFSSEGGKGYLSFKVGYKYVFSESQSGFYILPSAGIAQTYVFTVDEPESSDAWGFASALESGYSFAVGQNNNMINLGIKYEHIFAKQPNTVQALCFRISYSTGWVFGNR